MYPKAYLCLPDGLANILCVIILFGTSCGRSSSPLRFFSNSHFVKISILSILDTHFVVINFPFLFSSQRCSIFSLMDFCLAHVTGRLPFTFKFL